MTRAYVLDPSTRAVLGLVDQSWEQLSYTRRYFGMDTFTMTINRSRLWASELRKGRLLYLPDEGDRIFLIEQVQSAAEGSTSNDQMAVGGRSLEGIAMFERLVIPGAGQAYDTQNAVAAETAIKHYVDSHAGASAPAARQVPSLVVAPDTAAGTVLTIQGRYQRVFDIVAEIGLYAGLGWEIVYDPTGDQFVFDIINGVDRSADVFFDFAFDTLEKWEELDSILESKTVAVVGGQGEGVDREVVTRYTGGIEPSGFDRRETFVDARDVEAGQTTILQVRGDSLLAAASGETRLEAGIHQYGSFRYGVHWDMGDLVLVRNEERGVSYTARVVEVVKSFERSQAAPTVTAIIDRPFPTLKEVLQGAGASSGAVDKGGVSGDVSLARLRLTATDDLGLATTLHAFQVGPDAGQNMAMDVNEFSSRNAGAAASMHLNTDGGDVIVGQNAASIDKGRLGALDALGGPLPTGGLVMWPTTTAPAGYLLCDGTAVSRATYDRLFAVIGTTFGAGDGSTTFNLPDFRGRVPVGRNSGDTDFDAMGEGAGAKTHTHASHAALAHSGTAVAQHAAQPHSAHSGTAVATHGDHKHETPFIDNGPQTLSTTQSDFGTGASRTRSWTGSYSSASGSYPVAKTNVEDTNLTHSVTQPAAHSDHAALSHSVTQPSDHAAQSHDSPEHLMPYRVVNFVIKT